jgi:hypothetical protein
MPEVSGKQKYTSYEYINSTGQPMNVSAVDPRNEIYKAATEKFLAEGNEIIVADHSHCGVTGCPPYGSKEYGPESEASFTTAALDDKGKLTEVEGSREETFGEWNSMTWKERAEITQGAKKKNDPYCQWIHQNFGMYEADGFKYPVVCRGEWREGLSNP